MVLNNIISFNLPLIRNNDGSYVNGFRPEDFKTDLIGTSDCNLFIPFFGLLNHNLITFNNKPDLKILEYSMPVYRTANYHRSYDRLIDYFATGSTPCSFIFKIAGVEHKVHTHRGVLYDNDGDILMCLAIEKEYALNTPIDVLTNSLNNTKIVLFISTKFGLPIYKNIKKKMDTTYVSNCRRAGIDVMTTVRINDWLFKNNFKLPIFKNVLESIKYLKEEVPKNLLID